MRKEKTTNIYVGNQRIQIQKKHGFFSYFKTHILMSLLGVLVMSVVLIGIITNPEIILTFIYEYIPIITTMVYAVIIVCINIKWLRNHLYIPLTHDELVNNQIKSPEQYVRVIYNMFDYKPIKRACNDIEHTAKEEFKTEVYTRYYQKSRWDQLIPIIYIIFISVLFAYGHLYSWHSYSGYLYVQWIVFLIYIMFYHDRWW